MTPALDISYDNGIHNSPQDSMHTTFTYGRPIAFYLSLFFFSLFPLPFLFHLTFPSLPSIYCHKRQTLTDISLSVMFHTGATLLCFPIICLIRTK
ncbi:hypothetical protein BDV09DRAFT_122378 [Aspergillus tetrazonus]